MAACRLGLRLFIHLSISAWYIFTLTSNCSLEMTKKHPGAGSYGGRWKYLTFVNLVMQTVFFGLCCLTDIAQEVSDKGQLGGFFSKIRDFIFAVLAFPVGTFVVLSFWTLYTIDRQLVYPEYLDDIIPLWLNHAMHTVVMPLLLVELQLQPHHYPSRFCGLLGLATFAATYLVWILVVHHVSGIWVYPIMAQLGPVGLVLFLSASAFTMAPLYLLGEKLSRWNAASLPAQPNKKRKVN